MGKGNKRWAEGVEDKAEWRAGGAEKGGYKMTLQREGEGGGDEMYFLQYFGYWRVN